MKLRLFSSMLRAFFTLQVGQVFVNKRHVMKTAWNPGTTGEYGVDYGGSTPGTIWAIGLLTRQPYKLPGWERSRGVIKLT